MSLAIQCIDCPSFYVSPSGVGFSEDSKNLLDNLKKQIKEIWEPITIGRSLEETIESLYQVFKQCSVENWDGYGAKPISKDSALEALKFINLMPSSFPMPQVIAEPSGEIGFEWYKDNSSIFVLSFSGKKMISYAGIFGINKAHGTEYFGDTIPSAIIESLKRLYL